jgi:hypothetical protein
MAPFATTSCGTTLPESAPRVIWTVVPVSMRAREVGSARKASEPVWVGEVVSVSPAKSGALVVWGAVIPSCVTEKAHSLIVASRMSAQVNTPCASMLIPT